MFIDELGVHNVPMIIKCVHKLSSHTHNFINSSIESLFVIEADQGMVSILNEFSEVRPVHIIIIFTSLVLKVELVLNEVAQNLLFLSQTRSRFVNMVCDHTLDFPQEVEFS